MDIANTQSWKQLSLVVLVVIGMTLVMIYLGSQMEPSASVLKTSLIPDNEKSDTLVVFLGYVGCVDVCPPALQSISKFKKENLVRIPFYWINLTEGFTSEVVSRFADSFGMKGVQPESFLQVQEFAQMLGDRVYTSALNQNEIIHKAYFYRLIRTKNRWLADKVLRTNTPTKNQFLNFIYL